MLELGSARDLTWPRWQELSNRVELPCSLDTYLGQRGPLMVHPDSRRRYHRFHFRVAAILSYEGIDYAGFTKDISRMGMGIYSPIQLFPCDVVSLYLPDREPIQVEVTRCLRIQSRCYECGVVFGRVGTITQSKEKNDLP